MMDPNIISVLISSVTTVLVALIGYMGLRLKGTLEKLEANTNSIKDALVLATKEKSFAEGILEEKRRRREVPDGTKENP